MMAPRKAIIPLVLLIAVAAVYGRAVTHDFLLWDDPFTVALNPDLNPPTWRSLLRYWHEPAYGLYIPLTYTVWHGLAAIALLDQVDARGLMLDPAVFHLANVALHALATVLVYAILRRLVIRQWAACAGALLFTLHPLQVEAVAWVSGMKDVLAGMLGLAALWQYVLFAQSTSGSGGQGTEGGRGSCRAGVFTEVGGSAGASLEAAPALRASPSREDRRRWLHYGLATLAVALAMLAKPSAMVVPLMALIIDALLVRREMRQMVMSLAPWFVLAGVCAVVAKLVQPGTEAPEVPLWVRPFVIGDALAFYLYKLVWPAELAIDYGRRPAAIIEQGWGYVTWLAPAGVAVLLVLVRHRYRALLAAGCLFAAGVLPMLGWTRFLFQMYSTTADHYLYLAMLGPALAAAWVLDHRRRRSIQVITVALLVLLGVRSMFQLDHWRSDYALFEHTANVNPHSYVAFSNLGTAHLGDGNVLAAEENFREAIRLHPTDPDARENLARALTMQGRVKEAIEQVQEAVRLREKQAF